MVYQVITTDHLEQFRRQLLQEEKSTVTIEKYLRDTRAFLSFMRGKTVSKEDTIAYKQYLMEQGYAVRSVNSMLAALNHLLEYLGWHELKVKNVRTQRQTYCEEDKELTKEEYLRLLKAAGDKPQLQLVLQTICGTGIRVSELKYFTREAVSKGNVTVRCKGKSRKILIPDTLKRLLLNHASQQGVMSGPIFVTRGGRPLDRSNIWSQMKQLCRAAAVNPSKVFPHNLRKLFARTFYSLEKDIAKLADILGHGSIDTTRIYIMTTGTEHRRKIERLGLVVETGHKNTT